MSDDLKRPQWVSHLNQLGPAVGSTDRLIPLDSHELKATACEINGLNDFGEYPWEEAYERLVWSLNNEAQLNTLGRLIVRAELLRTLGIRLRLTAFWKEHPEVLESPVHAPIIIAGAARTGTSILQEVMSQDEQFYLPYTWRCLDPLPLGDDREQDIEIRKQHAQCDADFWIDIQPEIRAMHDFGSTLPTECIIFLSTDYYSEYWGMVAELPTWTAWKMENDFVNKTYPWHKRMLQTMQYNEPDSKVWLLKSPAHLAFLDTLLETYPDVRIIHTHRDPLKCIPSTVSVGSTIRWERTDHVDHKTFGNTISFGFQFAMENVINQRIDGSLPESQIADIQLRDLIDHPVESIERIYDHFNLVFPEGMDENIRNYLTNKPKGKFGTHTYDLNKFGMTEASLREQFKRYTDYYQIKPED